MNDNDYCKKSPEEMVEDVRNLAGDLRAKNNGRHFSMEEAVSEFKEAQGVAKTAIASSKLVGKAGFNMGKFAITTILPYMLEETAKDYERKMKRNK